MRIKLVEVAHARSGDKGDTANIGLIALKPEYYPLLVREVTAARVKEHFAGICNGDAPAPGTPAGGERSGGFGDAPILAPCRSRP